MDYLGDADYIATLYPGLTPPASPTGLVAIRESTARPPATIGPTPALFVTLDESQLETGNGIRSGVSRYLARFYLAESADLVRDAAALAAWATVLVDVLKDHVQLDGRTNVARCVVEGVKIGLLPYSGRTYAGVESRIKMTTSEAWLGTA